MDAGFARIAITPPLRRMPVYNLGYWGRRHVRFRGVRDPLFVRCAYLRDGRQASVVIAVDAIFDSMGFTARATRRITAELGLPAAHIFITCTHTHGTPLVGLNNTRQGLAYGRLVADAIVAAARAAQARAEPVQARQVAADVSGPLYNRRPIMRNGQVPPLHARYKPSDVADSGPVNGRMLLVKFVNRAGQMIGAFCHYGIHGVCVQCTDLISSDCMGRAIQRVEAAVAPGAVVLHLNAPCGDIDPRRMGDDAALHAMERALARPLARLVRATGSALPMRVGRAARVDVAVRRRATRAPRELARLIRVAQAARTGAKSHAAAEVHAGANYERFLLQEEVKVARLPPTLAIPIQVLNLGDMLLAGVGAELFTVFGNRLRQAAPQGQVLPVGITGAWCGYLAPRAAYAQGGYEVRNARWSPLAAGEAEKLVARLERLIRRNRPCG